MQEDGDFLTTTLGASVGIDGHVMASVSSDHRGILGIVPICFLAMPAVALGLVNAFVPDTE